MLISCDKYETHAVNGLSTFGPSGSRTSHVVSFIQADTPPLPFRLCGHPMVYLLPTWFLSYCSHLPTYLTASSSCPSKAARLLLPNNLCCHSHIWKPWRLMRQVQAPEPEQAKLLRNLANFLSRFAPLPSTSKHFTSRTTPKRDFLQVFKNESPSCFPLSPLPSQSIGSFLFLKFRCFSRIQVKSPPPWSFLSFSHNVWYSSVLWLALVMHLCLL